MKQNKQELDAIIERATRAIRDERIDPSVVDQTAASVWARVSQEAAENSSSVISHMESLNAMNPSNSTEQIRGCEDFQSLIPPYLDGELTTARTLLLEDHSNECIPCRRELKNQRAERSAKSSAVAAAQPSRQTVFGQLHGFAASIKFANAARWGMAAMLVVSLGFVGLFMYERLDLSGRTLAATVETADGLVYVMSDEQTRQLTAGEVLQKGERLRTAKDSNALLRLADGSTVEMRERSEFSVTENMRGVTVRLERGDVIVEAAKQDSGRLYVQTPDSLVSVKGTIFAVESGTKGSRVSVVEGEVKVDHAGKEETLLPGDQATTNPSLDKTSVKQNVAWSRKAAKYAGLVSELAKLRKDVNQQVSRPGVRYTSKFMDLVPENTVFYAALPNLSETIADSQRIMHERIKQNPALAEWSKGTKGGIGIDQETLTRVHEFGSRLGDEIVITAEMDAKGEPSGVLVLAEIKDPASFRGYVDGQIARLTKEAGDAPNFRVIDDPLTVQVANTSLKTIATKGEGKGKVTRPELFVWINNNIFAASPQIDSLRGLANLQKNPGTTRFASSSLYQRLGDVYREGAGLVVAADLEKIIAQTIAKDKTAGAERQIEGFKQLGVMNLRDFVVEQKDIKGRTLSRAALTFNEPNRGIASWLAAPGPMGALDFISPNANVATAFVVKEPALLVDDLFGFLETVDPDMRRQMQEIEKQQGIDIRNDFAAPLGGEFAFAIDGPILPTPSWKIVLEVYDQAKLQGTFERAIEKLNQFSMLHGKGKLSVESAASGDRTFYVIKSSSVGVEFHYTYANGYLVAAPSRALLEQSIRNREAGNTLVRSARFMSSLPQDGNTNFSAIFYHDLAPLMQTVSERMKSAGGALSDKEGQKFASIDVNAPPTLAYAYAQGDRITIAANTEGGAFGLSPSSLIGMPNSFQMQHILMNALGDKDVHKKE
ncbi:MAG TPA: FecR domain-containing protein [Pyrinomonadaceae bacterium]|nr:FecR domain-containing protein [Pyrinomonadaceae bacterium]